MTLAEFIYIAPLVTAGTAVFSAMVASIWAYVNIRANRQMARDRAAIDLIFKREWDARYQQHRVTFNHLRASPEPLAVWFSHDRQHTEEANSIRYIFNDYELLALAMRKKVIDPRLYQAWFRGSMLTDFQAAESAIQVIRVLVGNPRLYDEWEKLARQWMAEKH
ncbi:DUF4760 domain-containing protein [Rhabdaerophilum sp. SD176]|uniref:DUF4760 domain-containing protein n=1 Tax=Rhabdaerophilum sp. SD176 TaxID=2983548 RepID=UPI0024E02821|nr:DUF4760 domain-containing protein [Rhabdaerophilum sp. SD176]